VISDGSRPSTCAVGPAVVLLAVAPFLIARFLWHPVAAGGLGGLGLSGAGCPLLEHVGVPCAGCGASRAIFHFVHGDASFLDYNWFWIGALLALVAYGVVLTARSLRGRPLQGAWLRRTVGLVRAEPWLAGAFTLAFVAAPWAVAMLNIAALRGS
jgi:Protein of unknown function (DUF2752)